MRRILSGLSVVALLSAWPGHARAASACTAWIEFQGSQSECLEMVKNNTGRAGFRGSLVGATYLFWFGNNVVTALCIADHSLIVLAAYHQQNDEACPLSDRIKNAIGK
jgi:hypothetical protein